MQFQPLPIHRVASAMDLPDLRSSSANSPLIDRDEVQQLLGQLDESERRILLAHYGLACDTEERAPATLDQIAHVLGLSMHRVRQIERAALEKLRASAVGNS
jgi:RNA polymerase sigma factor (sigma-70 family)